MKRFITFISIFAYICAVTAMGVSVWAASRVAGNAELSRTLENIAVPPTREKMYDVLTRGITFTELESRTDAVTTTPEAAFTTDLTTAQKIDAYTQQFTIRNTSSDTGGTAVLICWKPVAWSGVQTCNALCAASGVTCSGASTDGFHLTGGMEVARRLDGTNCICVVGQAASSYQSQRVIR